MRSGLKHIFALQPDVAVVGEAVNGSEVLERLRLEPFDVLLLSMHNEAQVASRMLKAGANGYITKGCEPHVLLATIRKVAARGNFIAPEIAEKMVFDATSTTHALPHQRLSDRELEVFRLLTTGLCVNHIAKQLAISGKTVSTHKTRLLEKLNATSVADLMRYAMTHHLL